jgi:methionyl aminopeptidase
MLSRKTDKDIKVLREGGKLLGEIRRKLASEAKPGVTGKELNQLAEKLIKQAGGKPSFKNYRGFPCSLCVSVNQTVVHGVPNDKPFVEGDLVGLDIGMQYKKLHTDTATTVVVGKVDKKTQQFVDRTKQALHIGIQEVGPDKYIGDIGRAIEKFIKPFGYGIVRDLAGHGVGFDIHEDPIVPNYNPGEKMDKMFPGMVIAIEPMIVISGNYRVVVGSNKWDVMAHDSSLTAHFEHTVAVTKDGYLIITE